VVVGAYRESRVDLRTTEEAERLRDDLRVSGVTDITLARVTIEDGG
jgi:hypothetical protein